MELLGNEFVRLIASASIISPHLVSPLFPLGFIQNSGDTFCLFEIIFV